MSRTIRRRNPSRKPHPPAIEIVDGDVIQPGNSGSTLGTPPGHDQRGTSAADALIGIARNGFPERPADQTPFMFFNPNNMCYRNTVLALLLNTDPFLGWLRTNGWYQTNQSDSIVSRLNALAQAYWQPQSVLKSALVLVRMNLFWQQFNRTWNRPTSQEDVADFLNHLFTQMYDNQAPECIPLSDLFLTLKAPRIIAGEACNHVKLHTEMRDADRVWPLHRVWVDSDSATTLFSRIAASLHEIEPEDICPICGEELAAGHRFSKFAKLPEVLLVEILRGVSSPGTLEDRESAARVDIPEKIDLDKLVLDESTHKGNSTFDLIGGVSHAHRGRHFVADIRNTAGNWFRLDDLQNPRVTRSSLKRLNMEPNYNVVLVSYVRRQKADAKTQDPIAGGDPRRGASTSPQQPTTLQPANSQPTNPQHSADKRPATPIPEESPSNPPEVAEIDVVSNHITPEAPHDPRAESPSSSQGAAEPTSSAAYDAVTAAQLKKKYGAHGFSLSHYASKSRADHIAELVDADAGRIGYERKTNAWLRAELGRRGRSSNSCMDKGALVRALEELDTQMLIDEPLEEEDGEEEEPGGHGAESTPEAGAHDGAANGESASLQHTAAMPSSTEPGTQSPQQPRTPTPEPQTRSQHCEPQITPFLYLYQLRPTTTLPRGGPRAQSEPLPPRISRPQHESTARVNKASSLSPTARPSRPFQRDGTSARMPLITRCSPRCRRRRGPRSIPGTLFRAVWRGVWNLPRSLRRLWTGQRRRPAVARDWVEVLQEWVLSGRCVVQ